MLEHYFAKPGTVDRIRACWLGEQIDAYVQRLHSLGHAPSLIRYRVPLIRQFAEFSSVGGAQFIADLPDQIQGFVAERMSRSTSVSIRSNSRKRSWENEIRGPIEHFLEQHLSDFVPRGRSSRRTLEPFESTVPGFFKYLRDERGLREATICTYRRTLTLLEAYLAQVGIGSLCELSAPVVSGFITTLSPRYGPNSMTGICGASRVFLRYAHREGILSRDLALALGAPLNYRLSKVPRSISWDEVRHMLDAVEQRTSMGRRDYAILLLLVTYGLRAREVAALTLDDIDWERGRILIPERKAGHCTAYPLSNAVGEAICAYLKNGRPSNDDRAVFQSVFAPYRPMTYHSVSSRATHYLRAAGIEVHRAGSHTLRHTCVQRLIDADFSLKSAGDFVGHSSPRSTEIYTKIDVKNLRDVALGDGESLL